MSIFKSKKKFQISERDPSYKVRYLGNVQTALMKGDGCVDKPTHVLWNNFAKSSGAVGLDMTITICTAGMKAVTSEQGLTEYRAHRISYCIAHPSYPRVFVWVYRHEGKKMKVELRCHAVLCKNEQKAKAMAVTLHDKLQFSLKEFMREKRKRQSSRITLQKTNTFNSLPGSTNNYGTSLRQRMLSNGQKFKPSIENSSTAPKMGTITESFDEERAEELLSLKPEVVEEDSDIDVEDDETLCDEVVEINPRANHMDDSSISSQSSQSGTQDNGIDENGDSDSVSNEKYGIEIGNDIDALKEDVQVQMTLQHVDSDDSSSESGFSEQDNKESSSTGSGNSSNSSANSGACCATENSPHLCSKKSHIPNGRVSNGAASVIVEDIKHRNCNADNLTQLNSYLTSDLSPNNSNNSTTKL